MVKCEMQVLYDKMNNSFSQTEMTLSKGKPWRKVKGVLGDVTASDYDVRTAESDDFKMVDSVRLSVSLNTRYV